MTSILCLGMSAMDAIYRVPAIPAAPAKVLATGFSRMRRRHGGQCQRRGRPAGRRRDYWGRVGADALGERILAELANEGVDVGTVRRVPGGRSPSAAILVLPDGERLVCAYNDPALDPDPAMAAACPHPGFAAVLV